METMLTLGADDAIVIKSFPDTEGVTFVTVASHIACNVLCINQDDLFPTLSENTVRLKSWAPLSCDRRNAIDRSLKKEVETALEQINGSIAQIESWRKKIQSIKVIISSAPIKQDIFLQEIAEIQKQYNSLIAQCPFIGWIDGIDTLLEKLKDRIKADNHRVISKESVALIVRCHDITIEQFQEQLKHFHQNTTEFESQKKQLVLQWTKLTQPATLTTWGLIPAFKTDFKKIYETVIEAKASIGFVGRCINGASKLVSGYITTGITELDIDNIDLKGYLQDTIEIVQSLNDENAISLLEKDLSISKEMIVVDDSEFYQKISYGNGHYSNEYASFIDSIREKLLEPDWLQYTMSDQEYALAMIHSQPIYKEVYFWNKIPDVPKRAIDVCIKNRANEILKKMKSISSQARQWVLEISLEEVQKKEQPLEEKNTFIGSLEAGEGDVNEPVLNPEAGLNSTKAEEERQKKLFKCYQQFQKSYEEMSKNEIGPLYGSLIEIKKDIEERTITHYRKTVSKPAIQLITAAFDTGEVRLSRECSSFHAYTAELKELHSELKKQYGLMDGDIKSFRDIFHEKIKKFTNQIDGWKDWGLSLIGYSSQKNYIDFPDEVKNLISESSSSEEESSATSTSATSATTTATTTSVDMRPHSNNANISTATTMSTTTVDMRTHSDYIDIIGPTTYSPPNESSYSVDLGIHSNNTDIGTTTTSTTSLDMRTHSKNINIIIPTSYSPTNEAFYENSFLSDFQKCYAGLEFRSQEESSKTDDKDDSIEETSIETLEEGLAKPEGHENPFDNPPNAKIDTPKVNEKLSEIRVVPDLYPEVYAEIPGGSFEDYLNGVYSKEKNVYSK